MNYTKSPLAAQSLRLAFGSGLGKATCRQNMKREKWPAHSATKYKANVVGICAARIGKIGF